MHFIIEFLFSFLPIFVGILIAHFIKAQIAVAEYGTTFRWYIFFRENKNPFIVNSALTILFAIWIVTDLGGIDYFLNSFGLGWAAASRVLLGVMVIPHIGAFFVKHRRIREREE